MFKLIFRSNIKRGCFVVLVWVDVDVDRGRIFL